MARPVADLDRFLAFVTDLRRRAPNDRFHKVLTRRLDTLLDERLESAAHARSAPTSTSPQPPVR